MDNTAMANYIITPKFDFETGKFVFLNSKNKPVDLHFIPKPIDMRGGMDKRDYDYLMEPMLSPTDPGYIELINPFVTLPKSYLAIDRPHINGWTADTDLSGYVLIQGNTRLKLFKAVIDNIESFWSSLSGSQEEKIATFNQGFTDAQNLIDSEEYSDNFVNQMYPLIRGIKPFQISVLPENTVTYELILWLQRAANDAVKAQGVLQNAQFAVAYYNYLADQNAKAENKVAKRDLIAKAMQAFGLQSSRFYHYSKVLNSPEWLQSAVSDEVISLDTAIDFLNAYSRCEKAYEDRGKTLSVQLPHFWDIVKGISEKDRNPENALKVFTSHVKKAEDQLIDAVTPSEPETIITEGQGEGEGETTDSGNGDSSTPKMTVEQYAQAVYDMLSDDKILHLYDSLQTLATGDNGVIETTTEGEVLCRYTEKSIKSLHKALTAIHEVLTVENGAFVHLVTVAQDELNKQLKAEQKKAKKASDELNVNPNQEPVAV